MGRIKRKIQIPLSLFYLKYFAYIFIFMLLTAIALLILFNFLMNDKFVYPADYAQEQAESAFSEIKKQEKITDDSIPELCEYIVFDLGGKMKSGNITGNGEKQAWDAVQEKSIKSGKYNYMVIDRGTEYCVLRYSLFPQYKSSFFRKVLLPPQILIFILSILSMLLIILLVARSFGKALNKKMSKLIFVANKVEHQDLDFLISTSGIKEVDVILQSMDRMRTALKDALEQQWKSEAEKKRQMSALAHDLKTPLTIVRGNAELLLESNLSETQRKYTEYIESSSLQMQNYVQMLIEVTKSWKGYQFCPQKIECKNFLTEIECQLKGLCAIHNLTSIWDCHCNVSEIWVDQTLLLRAIANVISNATERTPSGGKVSVCVYVKDNYLIFVITDTGIGFSMEALKHGTEQFYMEDMSRGSKIHYGIGLYAANAIIKNHEGQLELNNSQETGGAEVTIKIPCKI